MKSQIITATIVSMLSLASFASPIDGEWDVELVKYKGKGTATFTSNESGEIEYDVKVKVSIITKKDHGTCQLEETEVENVYTKTCIDKKGKESSYPITIHDEDSWSEDTGKHGIVNYTR